MPLVGWMLPTTTLKYIFHRTVNLRAIKHERRERDTRYDKAKDLTTYRYIYIHTHTHINRYKNVFFFFIDMFLDEFVLFFFLFGTKQLREE